LFGRLCRWTRDRGRNFAHLAALQLFGRQFGKSAAARAVVTPAASFWRILIAEIKKKRALQRE